MQCSYWLPKLNPSDIINFIHCVSGVSIIQISVFVVAVSRHLRTPNLKDFDGEN
jgi:hypothetical protein